ncbi:zinc finger protein 37 isoform X2 [Kryptolebias marmoratus]|uniref:Zinc finger protein 37-like n=1 Tax=Kryptolebias marmoratus TaxID=37003 RepID=A0A3Q3B0S0_KRYMA|nr:zinc finger protein 37 isoform X2 [Kryptolebias marmoratus]
MFAVRCLREFISERLTAAAEEIFTEFEKTIVRLEEEIDRQGRVLSVSWKPQLNLHRIDLPQHDVWKEKDRQLCDQEEPEHPQEESERLQMKAEQGEPCNKQDKEQLLAKQKTENEERNRREPEPNRDQPFCLNAPEAKLSQDQEGIGDEDCGSSGDEELKQNKKCPQTRDHSDRVDSPRLKRHKQTDTELPLHCVRNEEWNPILDQQEPECPQKEAELSQIKEEQEELCISQDEEEQLVLKQETDAFMITASYKERDQCQPEPNGVRIISQNSPDAENQDQEQGGSEDSGLSRNEKLKQNKRHSQTRDPSGDVGGPKLNRHTRTHTGEMWYTWAISGECISQSGDLTQHTRTPAGEKLFSCQTCGKHFNQNAHLIRHMRTHTGEKPYPCEICGKRFSQSSNLTIHMRTHTGEKPFSCQSCGKHFTNRRNLKLHENSHR